MVAGISSRKSRTRRGGSSHTAGWPDLATSLRLSQDQLLENFILRSHPADKPLEMAFAIQRQSRQRADFQRGRDLKIVLDVHREDEHLSRDFYVQLFELTDERTASAAAGLPEFDEHRHRR